MTLSGKRDAGSKETAPARKLAARSQNRKGAA
jgi:hypothetical protein